MWTMKRGDKLLKVGSNKLFSNSIFQAFFIYCIQLLPKEIFRFSKRSHLHKSRICFTRTSRADNYVAWRALLTEFRTMNSLIFLFVENQNIDWIGNCKINRVQVWYFLNQERKSEINHLFQEMLWNMWTSCYFSTR